MPTITVRGGAAALLLLACATAPLAGQSLFAKPDTATAKHAVSGAQVPSAGRPERQADEVSPASPRASLERFVELTRAGRYAAAAAYLDLPDSLQASGPMLAKQLEAVLDRNVWLDLQEISAAPSGDTADGLSARTEQIAQIRDARGTREPVRLTRAQQDGETIWRFSRSTVALIPEWYAQLGDRWMLEHLPARLLRAGPFDIVYWQWAALPLLVIVAMIIGIVVSRLLRSILIRVAHRTTNEWDDALVVRLAGPITLACTLTAAAALIPALGLYPPAAAASYRVLRAGFLLAFFWSLWRLVDVGRQVAGHTPWARTSASSRSLIPLGARVVKVVVIVFAIIAVLSLLGYPVASLIAGLGLGGLAFALAAQKTVENLFGAFSIGVDQPFREGDFIKVDDFTGNVEAIGLRSTRIRTLDRTIITIPNGRLADMRVESFAVRDRLRFSTVVGLVYDTTGGQMRDILAGFDRVLREQPKLWPDGITIQFRALAASSLEVEVSAWFATTDWGEFMRIRQEILLKFMDVVERAGTRFAFPTSTIHVASVPAALGKAGNGDGSPASQ